MLLKCQLYESDQPTRDVVASVPTIDNEMLHVWTPIELSRNDGIMVEVIEEREKTSVIAVTCTLYAGTLYKNRDWNKVCVVGNGHLEVVE